MDEPSRQRLLDFVSNIKLDIKRAIGHVSESDMHGFANDAWNAVVVEADEFSRLTGAISSEAFDDRLDAAGLSGPQLTFKLAVIDRRRAELEAEEHPPEGAPEPNPQPRPEDQGRRNRYLRRLAAKLLDAIDTVLDSLVVALHGIGEIIKEFKQALQNWLDDSPPANQSGRRGTP